MARQLGSSTFSGPRSLLLLLRYPHTSIMNSQVQNPPEKRRRKKSSRPPGLLEVLIDSLFFQVMLGKRPISHLWNKSLRDDRSSTHRVEQSFPAMLVDVVLFGLLLLFVPFYRVFRTIVVWVYERYWVKFSLGVITGVCSVMLLFFILDLFFFG